VVSEKAVRVTFLKKIMEQKISKEMDVFLDKFNELCQEYNYEIHSATTIGILRDCKVLKIVHFDGSK
jgi:hypothetical protein